MAFECMNDCIHLHACRRVQKIGKRYRLSVPRYCTEDCEAYMSKDTITDYIPISVVRGKMEYVAEAIKEGYDVYDICLNFDDYSIEEILNDTFEEGEN